MRIEVVFRLSKNSSENNLVSNSQIIEF